MPLPPLDKKLQRLTAQIERLNAEEFLQVLVFLRKLLPKLPEGLMQANGETLRALLHAYLLEFGEPYDRSTFVDWCAAQAHWGDLYFDLREFYARKAAEDRS